MNIHMINQIFIPLFGCIAIYLVGSKGTGKRYGYLFGLLGQPFWIFETFINRQWGIFILSLWYTYSWSQGFYNYWIKNEEET